MKELLSALRVAGDKLAMSNSKSFGSRRVVDGFEVSWVRKPEFRVVLSVGERGRIRDLVLTTQQAGDLKVLLDSALEAMCADVIEAATK